MSFKSSKAMREHLIASVATTIPFAIFLGITVHPPSPSDRPLVSPVIEFKFGSELTGGSYR